MTDIESQIEELAMQMQELRSRQMQMNNEMALAERKLQILRNTIVANSKEELVENSIVSPAVETPPQPSYIQQAKKRFEERKRTPQQALRAAAEMEDFIGTNVISKVGILVTIIGVFIGAKYAIDNELISPFMRIFAGYLTAAALIFIAFRLKKKYEYFSSVLIGGGLAVIYFISYIAYNFYALFPLAVAFAVMVATTGASVGIALWYNQKVIALLGQVAAYAIPFLLSSEQGSIFILFSYITIINFGLLLLSFKKDWKLLYHIAFFLTWIIYLFSVVSGKTSASFAAALTFLALHFFTFYITFLFYKILKKELYQLGEIGILLLNALFFFFLGAFAVNQKFDNAHLFTWFTIANAVIHFATGYFIYRLRLVDDSVFQFILGLGLLFVTVAIPIELDGNWVTILWSVEAAALFYVAKKTNRELYLEIAAPLIVISLISFLQDWSINYDFMNNAVAAATKARVPFANLNFILSLFVCACFGYISYYSSEVYYGGRFFGAAFFTKAIPVAFLAICYFTIYNEIIFAWDKNINANNIKTFLLYQQLTLIIFSCLYFAVWLFLNTRVIKKEDLHNLLIILSLITNAMFLLTGIKAMGELREIYVRSGVTAEVLLLSIRYFSFVALAILWLSAWKALHFFKPSEKLEKGFSVVFNLTLLSVISNEFIHWIDISGYQNQYKLGLSLICGGYALALLFAGMVKKKKHLRIAAIVLFACTLLKLFFYDLASLSTVSKTIVLVLLGTLLLLASFLYNKYKDLLFAREDIEV